MATAATVASRIANDPRVQACSIDNRNGGFRTMEGNIAGLHRVMAACFPANRRVLRLGGGPRSRAPAHLVGLNMQAQIAAWANRGTPPRQLRARKVVEWVQAHNLIPVRAELTIYTVGFAATALDLVCHDPVTGQAVILEIKGPDQRSADHLITYRRAPRTVQTMHTGLVNSEYNKHQLQLAAGMYMLHTTLRVTWRAMRGLVLICTNDAQIHTYALDSALHGDPARIRRLLARRPAEVYVPASTIRNRRH
jgi:hypothetical protein